LLLIFDSNLVNICAICDEPFNQHEESIIKNDNDNQNLYLNIDKNHVIDYSLNASERLHLNKFENNNKTIINLELKNFDNTTITNNTNNLNNLIEKDKDKDKEKENANGNEIGECNVIDKLNINHNQKTDLNFCKQINKFDLSDEIKSELENPNLCGICFNSDISVEKCVKFTCNHIFCLNCVKTYLEKNIQNGKVNFF
jgi:hypothetical protein